jgi:IS30 family transposase
MKVRITEETRAEMRRLRQEGLDIAEIALRVGCGREAARNAVTEVIPPRGREFDSDEIRLLIQMHQEMRTRDEIAGAIGKSPDQVKHMLRRLMLSRSSGHLSEAQIEELVRSVTTPKPRTRPAIENLVVQAMKSEKSAWAAAADSSGLSLSEWVRKTLNAGIR